MKTVFQPTVVGAWMEVWVRGWKCGCVDGSVGAWMDVWVRGWMCGCVDGCVGAWMNVWMHRRVDVWMY